MNKEQVGIIRYVIILCAVAVLGGIVLEMTGKPAPSWLITTITALITYLAGVATPQKSATDKEKNV